MPAPGPSLFLDGDPGLVEDAVPPALINSSILDGDSLGEGGLPSPLVPENTNRPSEPPLISDSDKRALQRLVSLTIPEDELPSVIERIVSNVKAADIVKSLQSSDARAFIDVIDKVCQHFPVAGLVH